MTSNNEEILQKIDAVMAALNNVALAAMRGMDINHEIIGKLDAVFGALDILDKRLAAIERSVSRAANPKELLSFREAAKRLGVSRGTTLRDLIIDKRMRLAKVGNSVRIPASEIARVVKELRA